jgi:hypothetical protein
MGRIVDKYQKSHSTSNSPSLRSLNDFETFTTNTVLTATPIVPMILVSEVQFTGNERYQRHAYKHNNTGNG